MKRISRITSLLTALLVPATWASCFGFCCLFMHFIMRGPVLTEMSCFSGSICLTSASPWTHSAIANHLYSDWRLSFVVQSSVETAPGERFEKHSAIANHLNSNRRLRFVVLSSVETAPGGSFVKDSAIANHFDSNRRLHSALLSSVETAPGERLKKHSVIANRLYWD